MEEEEQRPNRCATILYYAWKIFTCLFTHVMLVTAVVAYCILGAYTFEHLESDHEKEVGTHLHSSAGRGKHNYNLISNFSSLDFTILDTTNNSKFVSISRINYCIVKLGLQV